MEKQLRAKTGIVKRTYAELRSYVAEEKQQLARIEKLRAANADEHDINKQIEVLKETEDMIPQVSRNFEKARAELEALLAEAAALADTPEYAAAREQLDKVKEPVQSAAAGQQQEQQGASSSSS